MPAQQTLRINLLDIDLAGEARPMAGMARDLGERKGRADWPQMHLRYTLSDGGQVIASGHKQWSDTAHRSHAVRPGSGEALPHQPALLRR